MTIVPIININDNDKAKIKKLFESSFYFSCFEATRKASEGMYLLITNKSVINKARKEADNLLIKFCRRRQSNSYQPLLERKKRPLIHNNVSSYVATLSKNTSQLPLKQCYILPHPTKDQFPLPSPLVDPNVRRHRMRDTSNLFQISLTPNKKTIKSSSLTG